MRLLIFAMCGPAIGYFFMMLLHWLSATWVHGLMGPLSAIGMIALLFPLYGPVAYLYGLLPALITGFADEYFVTRLQRQWKIFASTLVGAGASAAVSVVFSNPLFGTLELGVSGAAAAAFCSWLSGGRHSFDDRSAV